MPPTGTKQQRSLALQQQITGRTQQQQQQQTWWQRIIFSSKVKRLRCVLFVVCLVTFARQTRTKIHDYDPDTDLWSQDAMKSNQTLAKNHTAFRSTTTNDVGNNGNQFFNSTSTTTKFSGKPKGTWNTPVNTTMEASMVAHTGTAPTTSFAKNLTDYNDQNRMSVHHTENEPNQDRHGEPVQKMANTFVSLENAKIDTTQFHAALQWTTKSLYQDADPSELSYWLSQPAPLMYIYDTLPDDWSSVSNISTCIDQTFGIAEPMVHESSTTTTSQRKQDWNNCQWIPTVCTDIHPGQTEKRQSFMSYRYNYNSDVAYLQRFYNQYPYRTNNPEQADLFLVPYPHKSHCLCHKDFSTFSAKCNVKPSELSDNVINRITYLNKPTEHTIRNTSRAILDDTRVARHLFLFGADWTQQHAIMTKAAQRSMTLSLGPSPNVGQHWTIPYISTGPAYQPKSVMDGQSKEFWTTRDRPNMVGAAFGMGKRLTERHDFVQHWQDYLGGTHMAGKEHVIISMTSKRVIKKRLGDDIMEIYRNSTFCLILPGDGCAQKRFFDVILNGCIPVVAYFEPKETNNNHHRLLQNDYPSLVSPKCSTDSTYPFAKGTFENSTNAGIDILDLVVTYNGTCGLKCLKEPLLTLLQNTTALQEKRWNLARYASLITFGLSDESLGYPDAFMATIVSLRHRLWHILGKINY